MKIRQLLAPVLVFTLAYGLGLAACSSSGSGSTPVDGGTPQADSGTAADSGATTDTGTTADSGPDAAGLCVNDLEITATTPLMVGSYGGQTSAAPAPNGGTIEVGTYSGTTAQAYCASTYGGGSGPLLLRILPGNMYEATVKNGTDPEQKEAGSYAIIGGNNVRFTRACGNGTIGKAASMPAYGYNATASSIQLIEPPGIDQVTWVHTFNK